jgi:hypothetical protein
VAAEKEAVTVGLSLSFPISNVSRFTLRRSQSKKEVKIENVVKGRIQPETGQDGSKRRTSFGEKFEPARGSAL